MQKQFEMAPIDNYYLVFFQMKKNENRLVEAHYVILVSNI